MNIRMKNFVANAGVSLVLLSLLTWYMSDYSSSMILNKAKEDVGYSISQLSQNMDTLLQSYEQIVDSLYVSTELQDKLLKHYDSFNDVQETYLSYIQPYEEWITTSRELLRFAIYTDNPTFQYAQVHYIDDEVRHSNWYRSTQGKDMTLVKTWTVSEEDALLRKGVIRLTQKVRSPSTGHEMYTVIDIEDRLIRNLISRENGSQRFIIALPNDSVVMDTGTDEVRINNIKQLPFYKQISGSAYYSETYEDQGKEYLLTVKTLNSRSSVRGLKVIQLMPIDQLLVKVNQMKEVAFILLIISAVLSVIVFYLISLRITNRLMKFAKQMKTVDMESLTTTIEIRGNDEIGQLSRHFQKMMEQIHQLIKEVYQSDIARKELELSNKEYELYALQTQINPHYLFNTLNAIRGNLLEKGDRENAEIIKLLAQSFRKVLNKPSQLIPLGEELEMVETFLKIQVFRFGDRLQYQVDVPPSLMEVEIPRLSLHTIIENTIKHALEQTIGSTLVTITADRLDEECIRVTVADNGPGIPDIRLKEVQAWMNNAAALTGSKRVGLRNIHQRLQHMYGPKFGLHLESNDGQGARVSILLPHHEQKGDSTSC